MTAVQTAPLRRRFWYTWVVVQGRRAYTPDDGDAQAGGVSPPFTVCVHSWFEVRGASCGCCVVCFVALALLFAMRVALSRLLCCLGQGRERGMSDRCSVLDVALRAWTLSCRGLGAGADCGLLGGLVSLRAGVGLKCSWKSRPGAWRLCSTAIFLHMACFLCPVCLEPFY